MKVSNRHKAHQAVTSSLGISTIRPESVIGRRAVPTAVGGEKLHNIICKECISDKIYNLVELVLNPLLKNKSITLVPILNGAINFVAAILQHLDEAADVEIMPVHAKSFASENKPLDEVDLYDHDFVESMVRNRHIVLIDDILETGRTANAVLDKIAEYDPASVTTVFLIRKMMSVPPLVVPDHWLFEVHEQSWVFGFGMDKDRKFRHLRFIADSNSSLYARDGTPRY